MRAEWRDLPFGPRLRQPDQRTCGPACVVVARMVRDEAYAARAIGDFDARVQDEHARLTAPVGASGAAQLPWPRALGTPPWAVASALVADGPAYRSRIARWGRAAAFERLRDGLAAGHPVVLYVGSPALPRHVVLGLSAATDEVEVYDPARGSLVAVPRPSFTAGRLEVAGWTTPWFTVTPAITPP